MNRLTKKLASVMLVSAMVLTQPGMTFASVRNVTVEPVDVEVATETIELDDAIVNEAAPENESENATAEESNEGVLSKAAEDVRVPNEDIIVEDGITEDGITEEEIGDVEIYDGVDIGENSENIVANEYEAAEDLTPYYPTKVTIVNDNGDENPMITLCNVTGETAEGESYYCGEQKVSLRFYGEEETMSKIQKPTSVVWEPVDSKLFDITPEDEDEDDVSAKISISGKIDDDNYQTGTQSIYAKVTYKNAFETKVFKTPAIRVNVVKTKPISRIAITENGNPEKIVTKAELIWNGNSGDDTRDFDATVISPTFYDDADEWEWTSTSPYLDVSGSEREGASIGIDDSACEEEFDKHPNKKTLNGRVTCTARYFSDITDDEGNQKVKRKISTSINVTIKKADIEPVISKSSFTINKYHEYKGSANNYIADMFKIIPKYGRTVEDADIAIFDNSSKPKPLDQFEVIRVDDQDNADDYDYYIALKDSAKDDFKITKTVKAKLVVPYDTDKHKIFPISIKVSVDEPKITLKQNGVINLFKIDNIVGKYSITSATAEIESIDAVRTNNYNQVLVDDDGNIVYPDENFPSYCSQYPAVIKAKDKTDFNDYSSVYIYPYEYFKTDYTDEENPGNPTKKDDDVYNATGYRQISNEINNYKSINKIKLLVTFNSNVNVDVDDITNPDWKHRYKLIDLPVKSQLTVPSGKTYDLECTHDMIEKHEIPDGESVRYEYVIKSNVIAYDKNGTYEPEEATYVSGEYLRYPEGKRTYLCIEDPVTKVTKIPIMWNFGNSIKEGKRSCVLRLFNKHWAMPIDVKHTMNVMNASQPLPKTKFSTSTVTVRNDGSDYATLTIAGPNGVTLDGFTKPEGAYKNYTTDDIADNDEPIDFYNPYNSDYINVSKNPDGQFNSKVYIKAKTVDPKTGKARKLRPGTYKYTFAGFIINEQGDTNANNDEVAYYEVNSVNVVVIDAEKKDITCKLTASGGINTVNRYDDKDNIIRKGSSIKFISSFTNTSMKYLNNPEDVVIKSVKWYGRTISGNYINEDNTYFNDEPEKTTEGIITQGAYNTYIDACKGYNDSVSQNKADYPFTAYYDKDIDRIVLKANEGFPLRTDCTYSVKFGICSRDELCRVTDPSEEGYMLDGSDDDPAFNAYYREYVYTFKVAESIPALKLDKTRITLYSATPAYKQKITISDPTNIVHKYIKDVSVDSVVGPSLSRTVPKSISSEYVEKEYIGATKIYVANPEAQDSPNEYRNIINIGFKDDKVQQLLPGAYTVTLNVICEDKAFNTEPAKVKVTLELK